MKKPWAKTLSSMKEMCKLVDDTRSRLKVSETKRQHFNTSFADSNIRHATPSDGRSSTTVCIHSPQ